MSRRDELTGLEVAVIGMSGRFPGAPSVADLWDVILAGQETISRFTGEEAAAAGVPPELRSLPGYVLAGGVLPGIDRFDSALFGYSPRDASALDPQQRIFLQCAWAALEDAGYASPARRGLVGIYASMSQSTYLLHHLQCEPATLSGFSAHELMIANDKDTLATRVAYHLDLQGPAVAVQCGCSSSLVGIHLATQALIGRECDIAMAGGVSVTVPQRAGYRAGDGGVLSADGHVYAFDHRATGTVGGDGAGVVVLKPLADAMRDRDTVHAVIKGSAVNNDGGRKVGFTAPRAGGQSAVIRMACEAAGISPGTISFLEAHGTGTALGDPIEFSALTDVFAAAGAAPGSCALGTVKALIGHLDAAAGVAGFIKAVLALEHRCIPPSPYFQAPNPEIDLAGSPFRIPATAQAWSASDAHPRRAATSSFGMGGTNAHVVLEEAPPPAARHASGRPAQLIVLSAATGQALGQGAARLRDHLRAGASGDGAGAWLADAAFTMQVGRRPLRHRLALVCQDLDEAAAQLGAAASQAASGVAAGPAGTGQPVAFLFPGQGAQHRGMAHGLYQTEPTFRRWFDTCADLLAGRLALDLRAVVTGADEAGQLADDAGQLLDRTEYAQPALFAVEYSLARLWQEWGVRPWAMLGHSIGEYAAACLAGTFDLPDALRLVAARGRLMQSLPGGVMVGVRLPAAALERLLPPGACLAADNGEALSVASGPAEPIAALTSQLAGRGVRYSVLRTSHAFHSAMMDPVVAKFENVVREVSPRPPSIPFASNLTGRWITDEQATAPSYWARHLRETVRFRDGLRQLAAEAPGGILLEVGPGTTLTALAAQPEYAGHVAVSSLSHPKLARHDGLAIMAAVGTLFTSGAAVDWPGLWAHEERGRVPLPGYPFEGHSHWIGSAAALGQVQPGTPVADPPGGGPLSVAQQVAAIWRAMLGIEDIGPNDDFFALGGHSLLATRIVARVLESLSVELPPAALFDAPTLAEFTALTERSATTALQDADDLLARLSELPAHELESLLGKDSDA